MTGYMTIKEAAKSGAFQCDGYKPYAHRTKLMAL